MGFARFVEVWPEVLRREYDEKAAPGLARVFLGEEDPLYSEPREFFRRTVLTRDMVEALENVSRVLAGEGGNSVLILNSFFGGGKTHTLLTILHAVRNPGALREARLADESLRDQVEAIISRLERVPGVRVAVVDGTDSRLAPDPVNPRVEGGVRVQTVWGSIALQLGEYESVRSNDENLIPPPVNVLVELFSRAPTLLLVDEIARYTVKLAFSGSSELRGLAQQMISFMEILAKAVESSSRTVLVVTLPVEVRPEHGEIRVEDAYSGSQEYVRALYRTLERVGPRNLLPVTYRELHKILKVRMFSSIDQDGAATAVSRLLRVYDSEEYGELFGENARRLASEALETYPYHPLYLETLREIIDKHEALQKTRSAIVLTRMVVRRLLQEGSPADFIMPFHIDPEDNEIRSLLLMGQLYRPYENVVQEDIVKKTSEYEKPLAAKIVAKAVFARTYVYASLSRIQRIFPDDHDVLLLSYDPGLADTAGITPKDLYDALQWAKSNLLYLLHDGGRYWFTFIASPIRKVEQYAGQVDEYEARKVLLEYANKLMTMSREDVLAGKSRGRRRKTPFDPALSRVLEEPAPQDVDERRYVLYALLTMPTEEEILEMLYQTPSGSARRYANTIYLVVPGSQSILQQALSYARRLVACKMVEEELDEMYQDEDVRRVMKTKLKEYCSGENGIYGLLLLNIIDMFNSIIYPDYNEARGNYYGRHDTYRTGDTIIEIVANTLEGMRPPKYKSSMDWGFLSYFLEDILGVRLDQGQYKTVGNIIDYFYSNPRLPMATEDTIKEAIKDGVKNREIGIRRGDEIYYLRIMECPNRQCANLRYTEGDPPERLYDTDIVLPWQVALREQLERLRGRSETRLAEGVRVEWYGVVLPDRIVPVDEALQTLSLETIRESPLVHVVEIMREGVRLELEPVSLEVDPGEPVELTVVAERIGRYSGRLVFESNMGAVEPREAVIDEENQAVKAKVRLEAPSTPGVYRLEVRALPEGLDPVVAEAQIVVRARGGEVHEGLPPAGEKVAKLIVEADRFALEPLEVLRGFYSGIAKIAEGRLELEAELEGMRPRIVIEFQDIRPDEVLQILATAISSYNVMIRRLNYRLVVVPRKGDHIVAPNVRKDLAEKTSRYFRYVTVE